LEGGPTTKMKYIITLKKKKLDPGVPGHFGPHLGLSLLQKVIDLLLDGEIGLVSICWIFGTYFLYV